MLHAISFDLDDTLWHTAKTIDHAEKVFQQWLLKHLPELGALPRERLMEVRRATLQRAPHLAHHISELRRQVITHLLEQTGHHPQRAKRLSHHAFDVFLRARHHVFPFDGVESALARLQNHYTLGAITNGNANVFLTPLASYFDFAVSAEKVGQNKPGPRPFEAALLHAGCEAAQMLHIGDHPEHDMAGARALGMPVLWYNPQQLSWDGEGDAPPQFTHFDQLPALVRDIDTH